ncbi:hypothetical protein HDU97_001045 [Phlyctochytrium planicorne]|nr:hypothetical protein HDU97_001045 [Phlyctochytrium planicorne]
MPETLRQSLSIAMQTKLTEIYTSSVNLNTDPPVDDRMLDSMRTTFLQGIYTDVVREYKLAYDDFQSISNNSDIPNLHADFVKSEPDPFAYLDTRTSFQTFPDLLARHDHSGPNQTSGRNLQDQIPPIYARQPAIPSTLSMNLNLRMGMGMGMGMPSAHYHYGESKHAPTLTTAAPSVTTQYPQEIAIKPSTSCKKRGASGSAAPRSRKKKSSAANPPIQPGSSENIAGMVGSDEMQTMTFKPQPPTASSEAPPTKTKRSRSSKSKATKANAALQQQQAQQPQNLAMLQQLPSE